VIRPAAAADLAALSGLWQQYRTETDDPRLPDQEAWRRWILPRLSAGDVRVGLVDRRIAAYAAWQVTALDAAGDRDLQIVELYVHPDGRGQRIGSGLLARAIDAARQRGCVQAVLTSNVRAEAVQAMALPFGFDLSGEALVLPLCQR